MDYSGRQRRLREALQSAKIPALLVTHPPNVRYLCGFTGSAGVLLIADGKPSFFTDGRYREQARAEVHGAKVIVPKGALLDAAARAIVDGKIRTVGVEADHLSVAAERKAARAVFPRSRLRPTQSLVEKQRVIKEAAEIDCIRAAVQLGSGLFETAVAAVRPGVPEQSVAAELEYAARKAGAEGMSFETIIAAGARSALPHGRATAQPVPRRGFVVLDFGVILAGYCSDMTRTVHVGKPTAQARGMYDAVREAQQAAIDAVRPGRQVTEVDKAARSVLERARLARYFTHSTGHGVGLEIHEPPRVAGGQKDVMQPGMVITIEPGVYVPGYGGVRIEDMVVITEASCQVLTPTTKELLTV